MPSTTRNPSVAIVGAGMSGLCMAITLLEAGIPDVTIFEKADDLGGTWRDNTYPGLACDVPARTYQYTFALQADWSHLFASGADIHQYLGRVADRYRVRARIRFGTEVLAARFADDGRWHLDTRTDGEHVADFFVAATGILREPRVPEVAGLASFAGHAFHSARWDHDVPVAGRRVGVLGTGSTGAQIVSALAGVAEQVVLLQRTAQWVLPYPNHRYGRTATWAHRHVPGWKRLSYLRHRATFDVFAGALVTPGWRRRLLGGVCRAHLRTVRDPALRRALTPSFQPMCKRLVISGSFYRAVQRADVTLVTAGVDRVEPRGVVTSDGKTHELDVLVLATGFDAHAFLHPMTVTGSGGITLARAWEDGPRAYDTVSVPGFPNFFLMMGPHSPYGNYPLTAIAEVQARHVLHWVQRWRRREFDSLTPTTVAAADFDRDVRAALPDTVWASGCDSWYLGKDGLPEVWPWTPSAHRRRLARPNPDAYEMTPVKRQAVGSGAAVMTTDVMPTDPAPTQRSNPHHQRRE